VDDKLAQRKKLLEQFAKQVGQGNPLSEDLVRTSLPELDHNAPITSKYQTEAAVNKRALQARDLAEDTLAHEVMKNTGIPIPNDNASRLKREDFLKQIIQERYPEFKIGDDDLNLSMMNDKSVPEGIYNADSGKMFIKNKPNIIKNTSAALHEAAHKYDYEHLNFDGTDDVSALRSMKDNLPSKRAIADIDPSEAYELMAKGHHADIPKLREGSFGLGALKSLLKSGTFKTIAGALPFAGTAMALSSGDANAAAEELPSEIPGVGQVYDAIRPTAAGSANDDREMQNEVKANQNYDASAARRDALMRLKNGR
jgi:hypothetical protein